MSWMRCIAMFENILIVRVVTNENQRLHHYEFGSLMWLSCSSISCLSILFGIIFHCFSSSDRLWSRHIHKGRQDGRRGVRHQTFRRCPPDELGGVSRGHDHYEGPTLQRKLPRGGKLCHLEQRQDRSRHGAKVEERRVWWVGDSTPVDWSAGFKRCMNTVWGFFQQKNHPANVSTK